MDTFYQRAYSLVSSQAAREAFAIEQEPDKLRNEYGSNQPGQRMLLARRLVEAGVRFVSLNVGGVKTGVIPRLIPGHIRKYKDRY